MESVMVEVVAGRPCDCAAEKIGLSDGSSVYPWECSKCGHKWPVNCSVRGHYGLRFPESDAPQPDLRDTEIERLRAELIKMYGGTFQSRVAPWMQACFGPAISADRIERNHRFIEEALELVQSNGCTTSEAHQLVDYVFGREIGEPAQEVGGVMVTLAALCLASGLDMHAAAETELARVWLKIDKIRAKQAAKPKHSPLPEARAALAGGAS
jgi:hypothetical protein